MHGALTMLLESLLSRFQILPRTISSADSVAPTLHSNENGRENTFFTERRHSEQSGVGLTGSYETPRIAQAEVQQKCANSILVRLHPAIFWEICNPEGGNQEFKVMNLQNLVAIAAKS